MRLIRITTNYPTYLKQFYEQRHELEAQPYAVQYQTLMADCFMWADFWTDTLGQLGYEVWEPVANAEPMQKAWAKEHGVSYAEETWLTDILTAQVKAFRPDVLFVFDYNSFSGEFLDFLRHECPSVKLVLGWCGAPYSDSRIFKSFDVVLSNIPLLIESFQKAGHISRYMCHAFEPKILQQLNQNPTQEIAFSFIGSVVKGKGYHNQRENLLKTLVLNSDLQIFSDIKQASKQELYMLALKQGLYDVIQTTGSFPGAKTLLTTIPKIKNIANSQTRPRSQDVDQAIASRSKPARFGIAMYQTLFTSKVTLNSHIDIATRFASNMRLYEATGVGACLLTEWQDNLHELFEPDSEVVTYRTPEEALEKFHYLLEHEAERRKIALAGQRRTLRDHTFKVRADDLNTWICNSFL
jgi:spore maturation protein CgeB